jgi:hypothetical protein
LKNLFISILFNVLYVNKGLIDNVEYLRDEVGVKTLCLSSSIFNSDSYRDISPKILGGVTFNEFRKSLKTNDMHLILDIPYIATKNEVLYMIL